MELSWEQSKKQLLELDTKIMELPSGKLVVFLNQLEEVWHIDETGRVLNTGDIFFVTGDFVEVSLLWKDKAKPDHLSEAEWVGMRDINRTLPLAETVNRILNKPLVRPLGSLPVGARLSKHGWILIGAHNIGQWMITGALIGTTTVQNSIPELVEASEFQQAVERPS